MRNQERIKSLTRKLLHELTANSQERAVAESLGPVLEERLERSMASSLLFFVQSALNYLNFGSDYLRVDWYAFGVWLKCPEYVSSLLFVAMVEQPTRRFGEENDHG